jgi:hypothetical protein
MAMPTNIGKAKKAIAKMPCFMWIDVRNIAKNAGLSVQAMSRFLVQAKRKGLVENKHVSVSCGRLHLWRRVA